MRIIRCGLIVLAVLIVVFLLWFFRPLPPSGLKGNLHAHAYLTGIVKVRHLWDVRGDKSVTSIISSIPTLRIDSPVSLRPVPFILKPLLPQTIEVYLLKGEEKGGWAIAADLGWRSRLFKLIHGFIMGQIQYRGLGAIEGENIIRTPGGLRILVHQDEGTIFVAEGDNIIEKILGAVHVRNYKGSVGALEGFAAEGREKRDIAYISFSNHNREVSKAIEELEGNIGFLLLPSADSIRDGTIRVRFAGGNSPVAEISIVAREGGDMEGIEGDISYLLDLLDRFLSTGNFKTDRTINRENNSIIAQVMIHQSGGGSSGAERPH